MKNFSIEVCGANLTIALHPDMTQPAVLPRGVVDSMIPKPGDVFSFITVSYEYGRAGRMERDGAVLVDAMVMRRSEKQRAVSFSFLEVNQLFEWLKKVGPDLQYEKIEKQGRLWIKRTKLENVPPGRGRNLDQGWVVPLKEDIVMIVSIGLHDYATRASEKDAKWYQNAEAMQQRIFESLQVQFGALGKSNAVIP